MDPHRYLEHCEVRSYEIGAALFLMLILISRRILPASALSRVFFPSQEELTHYFTPLALPKGNTAQQPHDLLLDADLKLNRLWRKPTFIDTAGRPSPDTRIAVIHLAETSTRLAHPASASYAQLNHLIISNFPS